MASSSSTDSKFPIRRAPPVPRDDDSSRSSMQDLLTLGNDPFNTQSMRNELNDYNSRRKPPPRPPPPKSNSSSHYKGLTLILGKDAAKRNKTATAVVKPLPAAPVVTGTLIDLDSPSSSPTFSKLSGDLSSVSSNDSSFNFQSRSSSLLESGFDDDFDPYSSGSNRTTPGAEPWGDRFSPPSKQRSQNKVPLKFEIAPSHEAKQRHTGNFVMPTIIGPVKLSKPKRPPLPVVCDVIRTNKTSSRPESDNSRVNYRPENDAIRVNYASSVPECNANRMNYRPPVADSDVHRKNILNSRDEDGDTWRESSPPMPLAPAPPPPPEAVNIILNGPLIPPRPQSSICETRTAYCIAEFDYEGSHSDDLSFKEGDVISLLERLNEDWLRGRLHGVEGMFPENYVRIVVPLGAGPTPLGTPYNATVVALFTFTAQTWDDLDLNEGDEVKVSLRINEDWLYGTCDGRAGQFPENFVQDITDLL